MELPSPTPMATFSELWRLRSESEMRAWLEENPRWISEDDGGWRYADASSVGSYRIEASGRSTLRYERVTTGWMRIVIYAGVLIAALSLLSPSWLSGLLLLVLTGYAWPDGESPLLDAPAELVARQSHVGVAVIYLAGLLAVARSVTELLPSRYGPVVVIGIAAYGLTRLYSNNALPGQSRYHPTYVLKIPLGLVRWAALTVGLLLLAVIASEWIVHFTEQTLGSIDGNPQAVGSVSSDMTGGTVSSGDRALFLVRQLTRLLPPAMCLGAAYVGVSIARLTMSEACRLHAQLANTLAPTETTRRALLPLVGLYLGWSVVALAHLVLVGGILWFGLHGRFPLPTAVLEPATGMLPPSIEQTPTALLTVFYHQFDAALSPLPVVAPRTATLVVLAFVFAPIAVLAASFVCGVVLRPSYRIARFLTGTPLDTDRAGPPLRAVAGFDRVTPVRLFGQTVGFLLPKEITGSDRGVDDPAGRQEPGGGLGLLISLCAVFPGWQQLRSLLFSATSPAVGSVGQHGDEADSEDGDRGLKARVRTVAQAARRRLLTAVLCPMELYYGSASLDPSDAD
jgi:hypothetical protein